jgi:MFS family permease
MSTLTYMQLLRGNRSFRRLWAGQVVSELGNWFNFIAGLGLVRAVSVAAPDATAIMLVARFAPFALFAPFAGAFADRWSRRTVMIVSDVSRSDSCWWMGQRIYGSLTFVRWRQHC